MMRRRCPSRRRRADRGVTLVEVILSVVILASGVSVVAAGLSSSIRAEAHAENRTRAALVLRAVVAHLEAGTLTAEAVEGDFATDFPEDVPWRRVEEASTAVEDEAASLDANRFTYKIAVTQTDIENLEQLTISVVWTEGGAERTLSAERLWNSWPETGEDR